MNTYAEAEQIFATCRDRDAGKPIANNTRLVRRGSCYAVKLWGTDVVTFHPDGAVTFNSGGWRTVTTKARMNEFAPRGYGVGSNRGDWYLYNWGEQQVPYADGITVHPDGSITGAGELSELAARAGKKRAITAYARGYVEELFSGRMSLPGSGDCWYCGLHTSDGTPMGAGSSDHLESHIEEGYYVPSLVWNAYKATGAGSIIAQQVTRELQEGRPASELGYVADITRQQATKAIVKYIGRELGL